MSNTTTKATETRTADQWWAWHDQDQSRWSEDTEDTEFRVVRT